jgi:hypothetical protein
MRCYDEGALRAYLDDALPAAERNSLAAHLSVCPACRRLLEQQRAVAAQVAALLPNPAVLPDPRLALARFRETQDTRHETRDTRREKPHEPVVGGRWSVVNENTHLSRRSLMRSSYLWSGPRRGLFAGLAVVVVLLSLLALPPLRAAADQLLQIFRVQQVVFVPISPERIDELKGLNFDPHTLFASEPEVVGDETEPVKVDSPDAASAIAGFPVRQPTAFPSAPLSTETHVVGQHTLRFQVDVASAQQLLGLLGVDDVTLPESLGTMPITVDASPLVATKYSGEGYSLTLIQGNSPSVTLPDGVDMAQLGKAALRVLGLDADQAEVMSQQIDWNSTLVVPFPSDIRDVRQVQIGDTPGMLVGGGENGRGWSLYWQDGERIAVLQGQGSLDAIEMIAAAESLR